MKKEQIIVSTVLVAGTLLIFAGWLGKFRGSYNELQAEYEALASSSDAQSEAIAELQSSEDDMESTIDLLRADKAALQAKVEQLEKENEELKAQIDEMSVPQVSPNSNLSSKQSCKSPSYTVSTDPGVLTASKGVNYNANGNKETYYNLNMNGVVSIAKSQGIEGEYWVREDGVKMYGDYVIVAANLDVHPRGSIVQTSLGDGIVLDTGGFAASNPEQFDIATDW